MKILSATHGVPRHPDRLSEDAARVFALDGFAVAVLADGLGASREGRNAANRAVDRIVALRPGQSSGTSPLRTALATSVEQLNQSFHNESLARHGSPELLCTLSVVIIENGRLFGLNVGDSPVYLFRGDTLALLSRSHASSRAGMEHVLARALGLSPSVEPHFFEATAEPGDRVLLCSDGVSNAVSENRIARLLSLPSPAARLVEAAAQGDDDDPGLHDDATAIVLQLDPDPDAR